MKDRLVVAVIGRRNSGKSTTWNHLFQRPVRTQNRMRQLRVSETEFVEVFLVSGSPQERNLDITEILGDHAPQIVLCSMQYRDGITDTLDYFIQNGFTIFAQWLNPGFADDEKREDTLGLIPFLLNQESVFSIRNGAIDPEERVREIADFVYGWARSRKLLNTYESELVA